MSFDNEKREEGSKWVKQISIWLKAILDDQSTESDFGEVVIMEEKTKDPLKSSTIQIPSMDEESLESSRDWATRRW